MFAADGSLDVSIALEGAAKVQNAFQAWSSTARCADLLGIHVSLHRARVTTADDPAYCFGSDLNEFMKREREMRNADSTAGTTITSEVYRLLRHEQQTFWSLLSESVGTLGMIYSLGQPNAPAPCVLVEGTFEWLVGAWVSEPTGTWAYAALDSFGIPFIIYCYAGDDRHVGAYENLRWDGNDVVGTFAWIDAPITGHFRLAPNADKSTITAGWWYAEDVDGNLAPPFEAMGMVPNNWSKEKEKEVPEWAKIAIASRQKFEL